MRFGLFAVESVGKVSEAGGGYGGEFFNRCAREGDSWSEVIGLGFRFGGATA